MPSAFDTFIALVWAGEGPGLDRTPADRGNWTGGQVGVGELRGSRRGISAMAYPTLDIAALTDDQVCAIYRQDYWNRIAGDSLPPAVAVMAGDEAVNQGIAAAARDLQAAVGLAPDGVIGPVTLAAVRARNDAGALVEELTARRAVRYAGTGTFPTFGLGWMRRLAHAAAICLRL